MYTVFMIYQLVRGAKAMGTLGDRIKRLRLSEGLTQEEFGKIIGVVKSTVSLYEANKSTPDDEIKTKICQHFNVSADYLLGIPADVVLGEELKKIISDIAKELNEPYDKLVDIFLHKEIPNDITRDNLMSFFCILLNKGIKAAPGGPPLSNNSQELLETTADFSDEEYDKLKEYALSLIHI